MKDAAFALVIQEGRILLTLRKDAPVWVLPGGGIERGEEPQAAAIREVQEETGVAIHILSKTHEMWPQNRLAVPTHLFLAKPLNTPTQSSPESVENRYFPLKALPDNLFQPHRLWIGEALSTKGLIRRPLREVSYHAALKYFLAHPRHVLGYLYTRLFRA